MATCIDRIFLVAITVGLALIGEPTPSSAQDSVATSADPRIVRVGLLAHRGQDAALARWGPTLEYLGTAVPGTRFTPLPLTLEGVDEALARGEIDLLLTNPGHFHRLSQFGRLVPIVTLRPDRGGARATGNRFGAVIFSHAANPDIRTLDDLEGRRFGAVAADAFGRFLIAAHTLYSHGVDPWEDLGSISFLGFPQDQIVDAVRNGELDAGTVRTGLLESMIEAGRIEPDELRVLNPKQVPGFDLLLSTSLFPEWTLGARPDVPEPLIRSVAIALLQISEDDKVARTSHYGGWAVFRPSDEVGDVLAMALVSEERANAAPVQVIVAGLILLAVAAGVMAGVRGWAADHKRRLSPDGHGARDDTVTLTPRQQEILGLVGQGNTTKEIARILSISPKTVEFHRAHLMKKYDAHNVAELIQKAMGR